jgi:uncharacterized membrane protein
MKGVRSTVAINGHPLHPMIVPFPLAALVGALITDITYQATADGFWATASFWLLGFGVVMGLLAGLLGFIDFVTLPPARSRTGWTHFIGNLLAVLVSGVNCWLRLGDHAAAIMPTGLVLSVIVALILVVTGWAGGELATATRSV